MPPMEQLNAHEARVLGVLVEKAYTTPDQYPLTLNATANGSNQKSNRNPVVDFSEAEIVVALQGLQMKQLAGGTFPAGSRVEKWQQSAKAHLGIDHRSLAVLTELLLRGPQTPGELRTRANRMQTIASLDELSQDLAVLMDKGYVQRLAPAHGSRAERYGQLLAPGLHPDGEPAASQAAPTAAASAPSAPAPPSPSELGERIEALESEVSTLGKQLNTLAERLGETL